jgi:hypothetical protein
MVREAWRIRWCALVSAADRGLGAGSRTNPRPDDGELEAKRRQSGLLGKLMASVRSSPSG